MSYNIRTIQFPKLLVPSSFLLLLVRHLLLVAWHLLLLAKSALIHLDSLQLYCAYTIRLVAKTSFNKDGLGTPNERPLALQICGSRPI